VTGQLNQKVHIPSDLVVDHWTSDGESSSHRDALCSMTFG